MVFTIFTDERYQTYLILKYNNFILVIIIGTLNSIIILAVLSLYRLYINAFNSILYRVLKVSAAVSRSMLVAIGSCNAVSLYIEYTTSYQIIT